MVKLTFSFEGNQPRGRRLPECVESDRTGKGALRCPAQEKELPICAEAIQNQWNWVELPGGT